MSTFVTEDHILDWHKCQICYPLEIKLLLLLLSEGWEQGKGVFGQGTGCAAVHKVVHMLLYFKNLIGMNKKKIYADSSEFPAKCSCAFVYIYLC